MRVIGSASGSLITEILNYVTLISVSCLHFGQKRGKFSSTVYSRIFNLVLLWQIGQMPIGVSFFHLPIQQIIVMTISTIRRITWWWIWILVCLKPFINVPAEILNIPIIIIIIKFLHHIIFKNVYKKTNTQPITINAEDVLFNLSL